MNTLILGSGFGLYGYIPPIYSFSKKIYLKEKYKKFYNSRKELIKFSKKICWYSNLKEIIEKIDYVVIAQRPIDQNKNLNFFLKNRNKIKHLFLEKPIGKNPHISKKIIINLNKKKIKYSLGFIFEFTKWYNFLKKKIKKNNNDFNIFWSIKRNTNFKKSWKHNNFQGGGILRFYGIHFIKIFSDLDFTNIKKNIINKYSWNIEVSRNDNNKINLRLNFNHMNKFLIKHNSKKIFYSNNPFLEKIIYNKLDPRCFFIKKYIKKNLSSAYMNLNRYKKFVEFWEKIEQFDNSKQFSNK